MIDAATREDLMILGLAELLLAGHSTYLAIQVWKALKTGHIKYRFRSADREKNPVSFYLLVLLFLVVLLLSVFLLLCLVPWVMIEKFQAG